jgi:hypothetical protein
MNVKKVATLILASALALGCVPIAIAQESSTQQATDSQDKDKLTPEKKAFLLLDQVVNEAGGLKLPENRIYVQMSAADLLWDRDEARARVLFTEASTGIAEMLRRNDAATDQNGRRGPNPNRLGLDLRQSLVLMVAKHNGDFCYSTLAEYGHAD